jgi:hypothetical protein
MFSGVVKGKRPFAVRPALRHIRRREHQGGAHETMPDHKRHGRPLFLGERQELRRKLTANLAVERDIVRDPKAEEDRE